MLPKVTVEILRSAQDDRVGAGVASGGVGGPEQLRSSPTGSESAIIPVENTGAQDDTFV